MKWTVKKEHNSARFKDSAGNTWGYITGKELLERYPNGGYRIVADLKKKENASGDLLLTGAGKQCRLYPYDRKQRRLEKTVGYINVSQEDQPDSFVRIRKSNLAGGLLLPLVVVLLLCGLFFLGWWLSREEEVPGIDEAAVSYRVEGMENTDPESIALPGVSVIEATAGETEVDFPLINPDGNNCYMTYIIRDAQTDEVLYESGKIEPGMAVLSFDLNRPLEAGTYDILVQVETADLADYTVELNGAEIPAELVVR
nr:hypothetical protein [uncultured Mediterraneibacter sp.]